MEVIEEGTSINKWRFTDVYIYDIVVAKLGKKKTFRSFNFLNKIFAAIKIVHVYS